MKNDHPFGFNRFQTVFSDIFGLGRGAALSALLAVAIVVALAVYWFIHLTPPQTLTVSSGPAGSVFQANAEKYAAILARNGVALRILPSQGSRENLKRLADASRVADVGFVQGGVSDGIAVQGLVSLGSLYNEPLMVFYRAAGPLELLSQLAGKRIAIGPEGSGTRSLALTLLKANAIDQATAPLQDLEADAAAAALINGHVDAVFLMGDSAPLQTIRTLVRAPGIRLYSFIQADGYTRRIGYLNKMVLPQGAIDFGKNIPGRTVELVGPTVELVARPDLHPALSDLLLEAATEIHGRSGLFRKQGEFPAPLEHEFRISADAARYYKSGKSFLYRYLPFWIASIVNRVLVVFIPAVVVLVPVLRIIPAVYRWKISLGIYRWYRALLLLERELTDKYTPEKQEHYLERLDHIEHAVNKLRVPASFADRFYELRGHIGFVRKQLIDRSGRQ